MTSVQAGKTIDQTGLCIDAADVIAPFAREKEVALPINGNAASQALVSGQTTSNVLVGNTLVDCDR